MPPVDSTGQLRSAMAASHLDFAGAWNALEQMRQAKAVPVQSAEYGFQACHRAELGLYEQARRILRDGIQFDREHGLLATALMKQRMLAQVFFSEGRHKEAHDVCREMLATRPGHTAMMEIGCLLAQIGDLRGSRACLRRGIPTWPVYEHWQNRLQGEIALASGDAPLALKMMKAASQDGAHAVAEWPGYLVRAAYAAGVSILVKASLSSLLRNPARYWFNADLTSPGFLNGALRFIEQLKDPNLQSQAAGLGRALRFTNERNRN